jgi:hypothetical protein
MRLSYHIRRGFVGGGGQWPYWPKGPKWSKVIYYYIYALSAYIMSIFNDTNSLRGQSFAYGLAPFDPVSTDSEEFVESDEVAVFVDGDGTANVAGQILLHKESDPIDAVSIPTFSAENNFIKGLAGVVGAVPPGGVILYAGSALSLPEGWGLCDGTIYTLPNGGRFIAPRVTLPPGSTDLIVSVIYIVKLPEGAVRGGTLF